MLLTTFLRLIYLLLTGCSSPGTLPSTHQPNRLTVPLGGNAWVVNTTGGTDEITKEGLTQWRSPATTVATYVRFAEPGTLILSLNGSVPTGQSRIRVTMLGKSAEVAVQGESFTDYTLGQWTIAEAGYVKIEMQGLQKTGDVFGIIRELGISGSAVNNQTAFVRDNTNNMFYWGRRGPSVHLRYPVADDTDVEWFYNEITVPSGNDVIGSYYMANGFGEGYFGMQVNSPTERRILFSVWSPFQTDNPSQIPDDQKIVLTRKGPEVVTNEFGNEGSGGQSFLRYNWQAGQTYRFLLRGQPDAAGFTTYTAWFSPADATKWQLIASFKRPKTKTYLKSLYSFLENFIPGTGNLQREVHFGNQWIKSKEGQWQALFKAQFTGDTTAKAAFRMDYAGGLTSNGRYFLKNCGFFSNFTPLNTTFLRPTPGKAPAIELGMLP